MIFATMSTHNSTSFICNICLEPPAPTQTQHPGNQPHTTHNQPLQHNSALVLRLSLHPPSLHPLLKALVRWADPPTTGRTPTADDRSDQDLESFGFHSLAEIVLQQHWPICLVDGLSNWASWLHSEATHPAIIDQRFDFGWVHSTFWLIYINAKGNHKGGISLSE